jgi:hypothetical protein
LPSNKNFTAEYKMSKSSKPYSHSELLDPNHSHFILVDDAKHGFGGEVGFRADLESGLTRKFGCSCVVIVVGGGPFTARFVFESVEENTPCVFLEVIKFFVFIFNKIL